MSLTVTYFRFVVLVLVLLWKPSSVFCDANAIDTKYTNLSSCTNDTSGLPQCFKIIRNIKFCQFQPAQSHLSFTWAIRSQIKNVRTQVSGLEILEPPLEQDSDQKFYKLIYVDTSDENIPVGSINYLSGSIRDPSVRAVCITIWYVTNSQGGEPPAIHVRNRKRNWNGDNNKDTVGLIGSIVNSTHGEWRQANFHACVWTQSEIIIEAEKTSNGSGIAAIGDITVTRSTMPCACTRKYNGMPACHFNVNWCASYTNDTSNGNVTWLRGTRLDSPGQGYYTIVRDAPMKQGGKPGHFVYIDVGDENAENGSRSSLLGQIRSSKITDVCITFNYATTGKVPQTLRIYSTVVVYERHAWGDNDWFYIETKSTSTRLLGQLADKTEGKWKEVTFFAHVEHRFNHWSFIAFEGEKIDEHSYFALDNVRVSKRTTTTTAATANAPTPQPSSLSLLPPTPAASPATSGPSPATNGPSPATSGPSQATNGPSQATNGPSQATKGPSPATKGPSPATKGPSPATSGPSPATNGPSPATSGTSPTTPQKCSNPPPPTHTCTTHEGSTVCCDDHTQPSITKINGLSIAWHCQDLTFP